MHVQKTLFPADDLIKGRKVRLIELFAGVGAQAAALRNIGADFEHHAVVEVDKFAVASYNAIHGTCFEPTDIRNVSANDLRIEGGDCCYILTYSFPCQDLSSAGLKRGFEEYSGTRSSLLWEVGRLLGECASQGRLPDVLLMENVPAVCGEKNLSVFLKWVRRLASLGYVTTYKELAAHEFGVPQHRVRLFAVSVLHAQFYTFPDGVGCTGSLNSILDASADSSLVIKSGLHDAYVSALEDASPDIWFRAARGVFVDLNISNPVVLSEYTATLCARNVSTIDKRKFLKTGVCQTFLREGIDKLCVRRLTSLECWRLMGFSDADFQKAAAVNSNTQLYKQAGNSIVVPVLEAIFKNMGTFKSV